jgi:hypothetical protein
MGLDMYLSAEKYITGYDFYGEEAKAEYSTLVDMFGVGDFVDPETPIANVSFTVAYWRKANQIHRWFVENVQDGEDECLPHDVSREQLQDLRGLCARVLNKAEGSVIANPEAVAELLPTASGFFFGSTEYDEYYLADLKATVEQIDRVLELPSDWAFQYRSSW